MAWYDILYFPVFILNIILVVAALRNLIKSSNSRINGSKIVWAVLIIIIPILGPILYFTVGRKR